MTDTELLDFCDEAFKRDAFRRKGRFVDVSIGDISLAVQPSSANITFRDVIRKLVEQRVRHITERLTR